VLLSPGSLLVLYTDGLIEATHDIFTSESKLRGVLNSLQSPRNESLAYTIFNAVVGSTAQDDVAILTIHALPSLVGVDGVSRWAFDEKDSSSAQRARAEFTETLRQMGASDEDLYAAELIFGELVGNVVRHARGPVEVLADWNGPAPVLHVRDHGRGFSYAPRLPRDLMAEGGRGLYLVAAFSEDFNVTRTGSEGSHARAVISLSRRRLSPIHRGVALEETFAQK
jgi:anti-sigma regulatory factor (Ser/Thr protein kinase)